MSDPFTFADTLGRLVETTGYTPGQLAKLAGLPKSTLVNWLNGRVKRPRYWDPLLQLGRAMRLTPTEMNSLLSATNHQPLAEIVADLDTQTRQTLPNTWLTPQKIPFHPPPNLPYFVGREPLLAKLQTILQQPTHPTAYILQGMGGIGKTAVATRLAYLCQPFFRDGVLWAHVTEANPMQTLHSFAAAYGQDVSLYTTLADRSRVVQGLLAQKQVLLILDDAESGAQLRPLLPPTGRAAVLITTRRHDLAILTGAKRWTLPPLQPHSAVELITRFHQSTADESTLRALADTLGHHPLALTIAASRLAIEPEWTAAQFLQRLTRTQQQLNTLTIDDVSLQATFELSWTKLTSAEQTFFAALSIFTSPFTLPAACAATNVEIVNGADCLRRLVTLSLVQHLNAERYTLHPLLKTFAHSKCINETAVFDRTAAYFTQHLKAQPQPSAVISAHYDTLLYLLDTAVTPTQQQQVRPLIIHLAPYWLPRGLYDIASTHLDRGLEHTQTDDHQRATLLRYRGELARLQQNMTRARQLQLEALQLTPPDSSLYTAILAELGVIASCEGDTSTAASYFKQALNTPQITHNKDVIALVAEELGMTAVVTDAYETALAHYKTGLDKIGDQLPGGVTLRKSLGAVYFLQEAYRSAAELFTYALTLAQTAEYRLGQITLLNNLAAVHMAHQQWHEARQKLEEAYDLAHLLNHAKSQVLIEANLGHTLLMLGHRPQARHYLTRAQATSQQHKLTTIHHKMNALLTHLEHPSAQIPSEIRPSVFI